ncbi:mCG123729, isoform CRA_b, partial [Mus musculus]
RSHGYSLWTSSLWTPSLQTLRPGLESQILLFGTVSELGIDMESGRIENRTYTDTLPW